MASLPSGRKNIAPPPYCRIHVFTHIRMHAHTHTRTHTYTRTRTHTHTYTHRLQTSIDYTYTAQFLAWMGYPVLEKGNLASALQGEGGRVGGEGKEGSNTDLFCECFYMWVGTYQSTPSCIPNSTHAWGVWNSSSVMILFVTHVRTYIHTYINTYIHTYIHTYVRTYTHTHTYIHTCRSTYP